MNDVQPPPPPTTASPEPHQPSSIAGWSLNARNAVIAAGFLVLVLGALADIAHFLEDHDPVSAPATVLLQPDSTAPEPSATIEAGETPTPPPPDVPTAPPALFDPVFNTHTVVAGDVLYDIANRYGTTTQLLIELNELANPNRIEVGQVLTIPSSPES